MRQSIDPMSRVFGWLVALLCVASCEPFAPTAKPTFRPLNDTPCNGRTYQGLTLRCGRFYLSHRAEDYIGFAVLTPTRTQNRQDPVVYFAGGPGEGGNTTQDLAFWQAWWLGMDIARPLIIWDSWGNEGAGGRFNCAIAPSPITQRLPSAHSPQQLATAHYADANHADAHLAEDANPDDANLAELVQCTDSWASEAGIALPDRLSSRAHAEALVALMQALGYRHWHALAVSYGYRVAEWVAALAPEATLSLTLDSPYDWSLDRPSARANNWYHFFNWAISRCEQPDCEVNPRQRWLALINAFNAKPLSGAPSSGDSGQKTHTDLGLISGNVLAHLLYSLWYNGQPAAWFDILYAAEEAQQLGYMTQRLARHLSIPAHKRLGEHWPLAHWLTECFDNAAESPADYHAQLAATISHPDPAWTMLLSPDLGLQLCHALAGRHTQASTESRSPPALAPVPRWILVGGQDPVTPLASLRQLAEQPWSVFWVAPGAGHGVLLSTSCGDTALGAYWEAPRAGLAQARAQASHRSMAALPIALPQSFTQASPQGKIASDLTERHNPPSCRAFTFDSAKP